MVIQEEEDSIPAEEVMVSMEATATMAEEVSIMEEAILMEGITTEVTSMAVTNMAGTIIIMEAITTVDTIMEDPM